MSEQAYWNGIEPVKAVRGTAVMLPSPQFPQFWGKTAGLVGQRVPVVQVARGNEVFYLFNEDNEGWRKVTEGRGSPAYRHRDLDVEKFVPDEVG